MQTLGTMIFSIHNSSGVLDKSRISSANISHVIFMPSVGDKASVLIPSSVHAKSVIMILKSYEGQLCAMPYNT